MRRLWIIALVLAAGCGQPMRVAPLGADTAPTAGSPAAQLPNHLTPSATGQPGPVATPLVPTAMATPLIIPATAQPQTSEQRWRAQQDQRQVFDTLRPYHATAPVPLYWFDPATSQSLVIGSLVGPFAAQASFVFRPSGTPALEIPYRINQDFGLTAISPAIVERMGGAGYSLLVEAYALQSDAIQPQTP